MRNYDKRTEKIQNRLNPEKKSVFDSRMFSDLSDARTDVMKYIKSAMRGVEPEYTAKSKEAGEKVKHNLQNRGILNVDFKYQGSVMTDTHIKGASDIDLLTICSKFYYIDNKKINEIQENKYRYNFTYTQLLKLQRETTIPPYRGNSLNDLMTIRFQCENILKSIYSQCDITKSKAIKIKNLSLDRYVDVVIANWYDDVISIINDKNEDYRGIQVYDKLMNSKCTADFPFLSIKRINERSIETNGRLKKMIRFLKNLKEDSDEQIKDLSSFDINAICYSIPTSCYHDLNYVELVFVLNEFIRKICDDKNIADKITSVDGRELIFNTRPKKINDLRRLNFEIKNIINDLTD